MLVLARKSKESVVIGAADNLQELLRITVLEVRGGTVKLGFEADDDVGRVSRGSVGASSR